MIINYKCHIIVLSLIISSLFIPCKTIYTKPFSYYISLVLIDRVSFMGGEGVGSGICTPPSLARLLPLLGICLPRR